MTLGRLRLIVALIGAGGIVGMIVGSIADNNNGVVVTAGLIAAVAAIVLIAANAVASDRVYGAVDEIQAEQIEEEVRALVDAGANESALRDLVRRAVRLGRTTTG
jgi:sulfite exporter TauE/SafE